ncbi:MAG TPA: NUDIX hydrolase [Chitinophagaceae bacterium]|jgi:8-oxo-dGTP pyrophosphatase MutT (NUDIX family)
MKWEVLSSEYLTKHPPYFISRKDVCKKPDGTLIPSYYVVELPPSVLVFALVKDGKVLMIEQYRHPVSGISIELPGGFVDEGETALEAAKREMLEETGYVFSHYEYLGQVAANPGVLNNFTHMFLAKNIERIQPQTLERSEEITVKLYTVQELFDLLRSNGIIQSLHANGCFYALLKLGKLKWDQ